MPTFTTLDEMSPARKAALAAGLFYIATFVFSIPALAFFHNALHNPNFVHGAGGDGGVLWGAIFDVITALTGIGTAVAVYPVVKRYGQGRAVGFVASRTLEAATIVVGVMSMLALYTLRHDLAGTDAAGLSTSAHTLVALKNWTFLLGPGVMPAINALCLATILYQSGLVPKWIPTVGLIGAPMLLASSAASLFGAWDQVSSIATLMALPIATWEFSVGVYMAVKGFRNPDGESDVTSVPAVSPVRVHA
jgi:NADH:ubiquinone oxidoreductase subunit K